MTIDSPGYIQVGLYTVRRQCAQSFHGIQLKGRGALDNQEVIQALPSEPTSLGDHLAAEFLKLATCVQEQNGEAHYSLAIRWTAVYAGIKGNERVDKEAKRAVQGLRPLQARAKKTCRSTSRKRQEKHLTLSNQANLY